jgi:peroxiredoxin Q/BCP
MLQPGDVAPDVTLLAPDGARFTLASLRGRPLVLYFYPQDDTPGCTNEAKAFTTLAPDFEAAGSRVIGVSKDTPAKHVKFIEKHDLKVALATDEEGAVCEAFGVWVEKALYGWHYMGIERATFLIDAAGKVAHVWRKVKVPGHAEAVLAALRGLA